ncbi:MAG: hypothetical protein RLZZ210_718 [Pseudomonadota bacterium]|jgi:hypothetical protein
MSKSLRLSEKWFNRGLWLIAFVFASFLIGLGSTLVSNLPKVEKSYTIDNFMSSNDIITKQSLSEKLRKNEDIIKNISDEAEKSRLNLKVASENYNTEYQTYQNWLQTNRTTKYANYDKDLIERTNKLNDTKTKQRQAKRILEEQDRELISIHQENNKFRTQINSIENDARRKLQLENENQLLRVFIYRLLLTLPLLALSVWLFAKKRKTTYWPFVWGFILFALFTFFVELVPYLPSYGGFVRYIVGIVITVFAGKYIIKALNDYLERQKSVEKLPEQERKKDLSYDLALDRMNKNICPSCERSFANLLEGDFCQHCGIGLFNNCNCCNKRKNAFVNYCFGCGNDNNVNLKDK